MSLSESILESLEGFSLAKYSTWFFYRPDRLLLDCGEGVSTTLGNRIYAVEQILLSHGHGDHIAGIPGFLYSRASSMGDTEKPLSILYPRGDQSILRLRSYIEAILPRPPYPLSWREVEPDEAIPLSGANRHVRPFATTHLHRGLSLGYSIVETRQRLQERFSSLSQEEIVQVVKTSGRDHLMESYEKNLLVYSGDSTALPIEVAQDAELLLHEATFLDPRDREDLIHATVDEALCCGRDAKVASILLFHLSTRYPRKDARLAILEAIDRRAPGCPVHYTYPRGFPTSFVRLV